MMDESTLPETISKLSQQVALTGAHELSQAAAATGGLPVHADAGGVLVIDRAGSVLHYDPDAGTALQVTDVRWQTLALSKAARMFPELESLRPLRPSAAVDCPQCGGSGVVLGTTDCGRCFTTGWITD
jgi:hypothetical protein